VRRAVPIAVLAVLLSLPAAAAAATRDVRPGGLHRAIERAAPGDTLILHSGRYRGPVVIPERLKLFGARGEARPLIDGRCRARATITVAANDVRLRRLEVVGADESGGSLPSEVDFSDLESGGITDSIVRDTCDAEYGINVFRSRRIDVLRNTAVGFSDAGIYVGGITDTGRGAIVVRGNESLRNNRGFILEDSNGGRVRVVANGFEGNRSRGEGVPTGVFIRNSDGALFKRNDVAGNGRFGVDLDGNSDRNRFFGNRIFRNPVNVRNRGAGNCGGGNRPDAFPAC